MGCTFILCHERFMTIEYFIINLISLYITVLAYILDLVHTDFYLVFDNVASEFDLSIKNLNLTAGLPVPY